MPIQPKQQPPYYGNDPLQSVRIYKATLTQTGTAAPIATVITNTLGGTLVWTRLNAGTYVGTLAGSFPDAEKIYAIPTSYQGITSVERTSDNTIQLGTADPTTATGTDDYLLNNAFYLEIHP